MAHKKPTIEHCHRLAENRKGKFLSERYINAHTKYLWECLEKHKWNSSYANVYSGYWCPSCAKNKKLTIEECHGLAFQMGGKCLSTEYINARTKYHWKCEKEHQWKATYNNIQRGRWCPECKRERTRQTNLKKYGAEHHWQNKSIRNKIKETHQKKYGVSFAQQNSIIALKSAKSQRNSGIIKHWKTDEELIWHASYEKAVLKWLNDNKIDFLWQANVFKTPFKTKSGSFSIYRPDLYLIKEDKWIEIKGWINRNKESKLKWLWFHKECPNSELWDKKSLKEKNILQ